MIVVLFFFSLSLLSLAVGIIRVIISRKAETARIAAEEAARRRAAEKKNAAQAERERAAGIRKAEQERKQAEKAAARAAREAEQEEKRQKKLEAARELAELNERALKAARELKALEAGKLEAEPEARPAAAPEAVAQAEPEERPETISIGAARAEPKKVEARAPFSNQVVSFTGRLQSMRRQEAIEKVKAAGGKAFSEMPSFTTMLVVGVNPGMKKLDKYDNMIGQVRKITEAQFLEMLKGA